MKFPQRMLSSGSPWGGAFDKVPWAPLLPHADKGNKAEWPPAGSQLPAHVCALFRWPLALLALCRPWARACVLSAAGPSPHLPDVLQTLPVDDASNRGSGACLSGRRALLVQLLLLLPPLVLEHLRVLDDGGGELGLGHDGQTLAVGGLMDAALEKAERGKCNKLAGTLPTSGQAACWPPAQSERPLGRAPEPWTLALLKPPTLFACLDDLGEALYPPSMFTAFRDESRCVTLRKTPTAGLVQNKQQQTFAELKLRHSNY